MKPAMKTKLGAVFASIRTRCGIFAPQRALPVVALMALLPAALPTHGASVIQFPVSTCTVTEGSGRLEIPIQRQNDTNVVARTGRTA